jgi:cytochrome c2
MELNKIFAAVLLAGVIAMSTGFLADLLVSEQELEENAYVVEMGDETQVAAAEEEEEGLPDMATLLAEVDLANGESQSRACAACHSFDKGGANGVGPNLWGVVGGPMAHVDDFNYSSALMERAEAGEAWTWENLNGFIHAPRDWLPGTNMSYGGLKNHENRADLLAWMNEQADEPLPYPEPAAEEAPAEETAEAPAEEAADETEMAAADTETAPAEGTTTEEAAAEETTTEDTATAEADAAPEAAEEEAVDEVAQEEAAAAEEQAAEATEETAAAEETATEEAATDQAAAEETAGEGAGEATGFVAKVAAADPSQGQNVARACMACHAFEEGGGNRIGPALWDVVGRDIAGVEGFRYSQAMQEYASEGDWTFERLGAYLADPRGVVPGTNMAYAGVQNEDDLAALIAWMRTLSNDPVPLPE